MHKFKQVIRKAMKGIQQLSQNECQNTLSLRKNAWKTKKNEEVIHRMFNGKK